MSELTNYIFYQVIIMSTRCQVEFIFKNLATREHKIRNVYRHYDGYPSAMIADLLKFHRWNKGYNLDVEYAAANWIYWNKREMEQFYNLKWNNIKWEGENEILMHGDGICNNGEYHRDIEYLYQVVIGMGEAIINVFIVIDDDFTYTDSSKLIGVVQIPEDLSDDNIKKIVDEFYANSLLRLKFR